GVGDGVEVPLVGHAQGDRRVRRTAGRDHAFVYCNGQGVGSPEGGIGPDPFVREQAADVIGIAFKAVRDDVRDQGGRGHRSNGGVSEREGIEDLPLAGGDHERIVLNDVVGLFRDRVYVDAVTEYGHRVIASECRIDVNILIVVHHVDVGRCVGIPYLVKVVPAGNVVSEIHVTVVQVGHHQDQIVDELGAGNGIAGRIGPNQ